MPRTTLEEWQRHLPGWIIRVLGGNTRYLVLKILRRRCYLSRSSARHHRPFACSCSHGRSHIRSDACHGSRTCALCCSGAHFPWTSNCTDSALNSFSRCARESSSYGRGHARLCICCRSTRSCTASRRSCSPSRTS